MLCVAPLFLLVFCTFFKMWLVFFWHQWCHLQFSPSLSTLYKRWAILINYKDKVYWSQKVWEIWKFFWWCSADIKAYLKQSSFFRIYCCCFYLLDIFCNLYTNLRDLEVTFTKSQAKLLSFVYSTRFFLYFIKIHI